MTDHIFVTPKDHEGQDCYPCMICEGGLALCKTCGGLEGALTTECCGRPITAEEQEQIYKGELDYIGGGWINKASANSPAAHRKHNTKGDKFNPRDVAILGGDPSL